MTDFEQALIHVLIEIRDTLRGHKTTPATETLLQKDAATNNNAIINGGVQVSDVQVARQYLDRAQRRAMKGKK